MLSGFVIAHSYGVRLRTDMGFFEYILKRIIRLYPMFILGVVIGGIVLWFLAKQGASTHHNRSIFGGMFFNSLFLPDFNSFEIRNFGDGITSGEVFPTDPPLWSLFFEMVASLVFPFLVKLERIDLIRVIISSFSALLIFGFVNAFMNGQFAFDLGGGWGESNFLDGFPRVFFGFSFGILLYSLIDDARLIKPLAFARGFIRGPNTIYLLMILVFNFPNLAKGLYPALILAVVAPCLVFIGATLTCEGRISRKVARILGWISFPIYCLHFPVGRIVFLVSNKAHYSTSFKVLASSAITFLLSVIFTKLYDEPVRAYLSKKLSEFLHYRVQPSAVGDEEHHQKELGDITPGLS